jgi:hypothetical protein
LLIFQEYSKKPGALIAFPSGCVKYSGESPEEQMPVIMLPVSSDDFASY